MKGHNVVQLNDKGIVTICAIILVTVFMLGFMTSEALRVGFKQPEFTISDAERIIQLQAIEDSKRNGGAEVYATKDRGGELVVHWRNEDLRTVSKH